MNTMELWEANDYIENIKYLDTNSWEQSRLIAYIIGNLFTKNPKKMDEWLPLPWEKAAKEEEHIIEISNEDISRLDSQSKLFSLL